MKTLEIIGFKRANLGKKEANDLRAEGNVPCVFYGGKNLIHFYTPAYLFKDLVYTETPHFVDLTVDGKTYKAKLQEVQFHPVSEVILHADFLELSKKPVIMEIPVRFEGTAPGVVKGGKLVQKLRRFSVKATPENMPEDIEVDISKLELGKSAKVSDVKAENFQILNPKSNPVVTVDVPRALKGQGTEEAA
jgi:large subunit ribosomal protein L25